MRQPGVYLLLEDTTELSWSGKQATLNLSLFVAAQNRAK
jgi:hypothetical protein